MSFNYNYRAGELSQAAQRLAYFETDSKTTPMAYGVPLQGRTHLDGIRFIGCGAWFSDNIVQEELLSPEQRAQTTWSGSDDEYDMYEAVYDSMVEKLRERARAKWSDSFVTPEDLAAFLNEEVPKFGAGVLPNPLGAEFCDFIRGDMERCWACHTERVNKQLAAMEADLAAVRANFDARKRKWAEIQGGDFYAAPAAAAEGHALKKARSDKKC